MRRVTAAVTAMGLVAFLASCGGDDPPAAAAGLDTRTLDAGAVEITITPTRLDDTGATFEIAFDTHSGSLELEVAADTTLTVDHQGWADPAWDGNAPGGHHREGTLTFAANGAARGDIVLTIGGFRNRVTAEWTLPGGD